MEQLCDAALESRVNDKRHGERSVELPGPGLIFHQSNPLHDMTHAMLRQWIVDVLRRRRHVVAIAVRQRAKFEGWLKFELAAYAEKQGATKVEVEVSSANVDVAGRADISFNHSGCRWDIELKTPNANWQLPGVRNRCRPITQNIGEVIADARKLTRYSRHGFVAFALFPIPVGDRRWQVYLERIASELAMPLTPTEHTSQITLRLEARHRAEVAIGVFAVQAKARL